jgi:hypothetical protein
VWQRSRRNERVALSINHGDETRVGRMGEAVREVMLGTQASGVVVLEFSTVRAHIDGAMVSLTNGAPVRHV